MTHAQISRIAALLDVAEMAASEEREFWNDQTTTEDNRPPDWLGLLEDQILSTTAVVGAFRTERGWAIPIPSDPGRAVDSRGSTVTRQFRTCLHPGAAVG